MSTDAIGELAAIFRRHFGVAPTDLAPVGGGQQRSRLCRCRLPLGAGNAQVSIIVKQITGEAGWWLNDWAAAAMVGGMLATALRAQGADILHAGQTWA